MSTCGTDVRALSEALDVDLPPEKLQRLARVDALLRAVATSDRSGSVASNGGDSRGIGGDAT
jgi:hypothetical protein